MSFGGLYAAIHRRRYGMHRASRASASPLQTLPVWTNRLNHVATLKGHHGCVNAINFSHDGRLLLSGADDQRVSVYRLPNFMGDEGTESVTPDHVFETSHEGNIFNAKFVPNTDNSQMITVAMDGKVIHHDLTRSDIQTAQNIIDDNYDMSCDISFQDETGHVFAAAQTTHVGVYDLRAPDDFIFKLKRPTARNMLLTCQFDPFNPAQLATSEMPSCIALVDMRLLETHEDVLFDYAIVKDHNPHWSDSSRLLCYVEFSKQRRGIMLANYNNDDPILIDWQREPISTHNSDFDQDVTSFEIQRYTGRQNEDTFIKGATFYSDDRFVVTGSDNSMVYMWDTVTGKLVHQFRGDSHIPNSVVTHEHRMAVSGIDHTTKIFDINAMFPCARHLTPSLTGTHKTNMAMLHGLPMRSSEIVTTRTLQTRIDQAQAVLKDIDVTQDGSVPGAQRRLTRVLSTLHSCATLEPQMKELESVVVAIVMQMAECMFQQTSYTQCLKSCKRLLRVRPNLQSAILRQAQCQLKLDNPRAALKTIAKAEPSPETRELEAQIKTACDALPQSDVKDGATDESDSDSDEGPERFVTNASADGIWSSEDEDDEDEDDFGHMAVDSLDFFRHLSEEFEGGYEEFSAAHQAGHLLIQMIRHQLLRQGVEDEEEEEEEDDDVFAATTTSSKKGASRHKNLAKIDTSGARLDKSAVAHVQTTIRSSVLQVHNFPLNAGHFQCPKVYQCAFRLHPRLGPRDALKAIDSKLQGLRLQGHFLWYIYQAAQDRPIYLLRFLEVSEDEIGLDQSRSRAPTTQRRDVVTNDESSDHFRGVSLTDLHSNAAADPSSTSGDVGAQSGAPASVKQGQTLNHGVSSSHVHDVLSASTQQANLSGLVNAAPSRRPCIGLQVFGTFQFDVQLRRDIVSLIGSCLDEETYSKLSTPSMLSASTVKLTVADLKFMRSSKQPPQIQVRIPIPTAFRNHKRLLNMAMEKLSLFLRPCRVRTDAIATGPGTAETSRAHSTISPSHQRSGSVSSETDLQGPAELDSDAVCELHSRDYLLMYQQCAAQPDFASVMHRGRVYNRFSRRAVPPPAAQPPAPSTKKTTSPKTPKEVMTERVSRAVGEGMALVEVSVRYPYNERQCHNCFQSDTGCCEYHLHMSCLPQYQRWSDASFIVASESEEEDDDDVDDQRPDAFSRSASMGALSDVGSDLELQDIMRREPTLKWLHRQFFVCCQPQSLSSATSLREDVSQHCERNTCGTSKPLLVRQVFSALGHCRTTILPKAKPFQDVGGPRDHDASQSVFDPKQPLDALPQLVLNGFIRGSLAAEELGQFVTNALSEAVLEYYLEECCAPLASSALFHTSMDLVSPTTSTLHDQGPSLAEKAKCTSTSTMPSHSMSASGSRPALLRRHSTLSMSTTSTRGASSSSFRVSDPASRHLPHDNTLEAHPPTSINPSVTQDHSQEDSTNHVPSGDAWTEPKEMDMCPSAFSHRRTRSEPFIEVSSLAKQCSATVPEDDLSASACTKIHERTSSEDEASASGKNTRNMKPAASSLSCDGEPPTWSATMQSSTTLAKPQSKRVRSEDSSGSLAGASSSHSTVTPPSASVVRFASSHSKFTPTSLPEDYSDEKCAEQSGSVGGQYSTTHVSGGKTSGFARSAVSEKNPVKVSSSHSVQQDAQASFLQRQKQASPLSQQTQDTTACDNPSFLSVEGEALFGYVAAIAASRQAKSMATTYNSFALPPVTDCRPTLERIEEVLQASYAVTSFCVPPRVDLGAHEDKKECNDVAQELVSVLNDSIVAYKDNVARWTEIDLLAGDGTMRTSPTEAEPVADPNPDLEADLSFEDMCGDVLVKLSTASEFVSRETSLSFSNQDPSVSHSGSRTHIRHLHSDRGPLPPINQCRSPAAKGAGCAVAPSLLAGSGLPGQQHGPLSVLFAAAFEDETLGEHLIRTRTASFASASSHDTLSRSWHPASPSVSTLSGSVSHDPHQQAPHTMPPPQHLPATQTGTALSSRLSSRASSDYPMASSTSHLSHSATAASPSINSTLLHTDVSTAPSIPGALSMLHSSQSQLFAANDTHRSASVALHAKGNVQRTHRHASVLVVACNGQVRVLTYNVNLDLRKTLLDQLSSILTWPVTRNFLGRQVVLSKLGLFHCANAKANRNLDTAMSTMLVSETAESVFCNPTQPLVSSLGEQSVLAQHSSARVQPSSQELKARSTSSMTHTATQELDGNSVSAWSFRTKIQSLIAPRFVPMPQGKDWIERHYKHTKELFKVATLRCKGRQHREEVYNAWFDCTRALMLDRAARTASAPSSASSRPSTATSIAPSPMSSGPSPPAQIRCMPEFTKLLRLSHYCATPILFGGLSTMSMSEVVPQLSRQSSHAGFPDSTPSPSGSGIAVDSVRSTPQSQPHLQPFIGTQSPRGEYDASDSLRRRSSSVHRPEDVLETAEMVECDAAMTFSNYLDEFRREYVDHISTLGFSQVYEDAKEYGVFLQQCEQSECINLGTICTPVTYLQKLRSLDRFSGVIVLLVFGRGYYVHVRMYSMTGPGFAGETCLTFEQKWYRNILPPAEFSSTCTRTKDDIHVNSAAYDFNIHKLTKMLSTQQLGQRLCFIEAVRRLSTWHTVPPTKARNKMQRLKVSMLDMCLSPGGSRHFPKKSPIGQLVQRAFNGTVLSSLSGRSLSAFQSRSSTSYSTMFGDSQGRSASSPPAHQVLGSPTRHWDEAWSLDSYNHRVMASSTVPLDELKVALSRMISMNVLLQMLVDNPEAYRFHAMTDSDGFRFIVADCSDFEDNGGDLDGNSVTYLVISKVHDEVADPESSLVCYLLQNNSTFVSAAQYQQSVMNATQFLLETLARVYKHYWYRSLWTAVAAAAHSQTFSRSSESQTIGTHGSKPKPVEKSRKQAGFFRMRKSDSAMSDNVREARSTKTLTQDPAPTSATTASGALQSAVGSYTSTTSLDDNFHFLTNDGYSQPFTLASAFQQLLVGIKAISFEETDAALATFPGQYIPWQTIISHTLALRTWEMLEVETSSIFSPEPTRHLVIFADSSEGRSHEVAAVLVERPDQPVLCFALSRKNLSAETRAPSARMRFRQASVRSRGSSTHVPATPTRSPGQSSYLQDLDDTVRDTLHKHTANVVNMLLAAMWSTLE
eukprot:m.109687 g.109687  ORF g.109687 m.109687 type:complete len:3128 (-) comp13379_c2_seq3:156-9539(-)